MRTYSLLMLLLLSACSISIGPPHNISPSRDSSATGWTDTARAGATEKMTNGGKEQWCVSDVRTVKVLNLKPITVKDDKALAMKRLTKEVQTLSFGDSCLAESGGWWEWMGVDTDTEPQQVLVRYWTPPHRSKFFSCPSQVLFFVSAEEWGQRCTPAENIAVPRTPPQEEKEKVRQLLKDAGKK